MPERISPASLATVKQANKFAESFSEDGLGIRIIQNGDKDFLLQKVEQRDGYKYVVSEKISSGDAQVIRERAMLPKLWEYGRSENKPPIPEHLPDPVHSDNALKTLERRYLAKDAEGKIIETPKEMYWRVAHNIATAELAYGGTEEDVAYWREKFYLMMAKGEFLPNSPTIMNAGRDLQQLSACYVLPVPDDMEGILKTFKDAAMIHKSGGGTGFSFTRLRPEGDHISTTGGESSGPIGFMEMPNENTEVVKQGGTRRGANMGIMNVEHPDIAYFITLKSYEYNMTNFNISVAVNDEFIDAVEKDAKYTKDWEVPAHLVDEMEEAWSIMDGEDRRKAAKIVVEKIRAELRATNLDEGYNIVNPRNGEAADRYNAKKVFDLICYMAWRKGDPGLVNLDQINYDNPTPTLGMIEATNPCGEQPLLPYEACNLGSVNFSKFVNSETRQWDWDRLSDVSATSARFLENVVVMNKYPLPEIDDICRRNRRIGDGVMGWHDALIKRQIPYDSDQALEEAEMVASFFQKKVHEADIKLGEERGVFPNWEISIYNPENDFPNSNPKWKGERLRNACPTTIAPTGTISMIADCSSGIEPIFGVGYVKEVMEGTKLPYLHEEFIKIAKERGFYSEELIEKIAAAGSVQGFDEVPDDVKRIFITAYDIPPDRHAKMQLAWQKYTDNAVSKTINFPFEATVEDVRTGYWETIRGANGDRGKGVTVFRTGSRRKQVLKHGSDGYEVEGVKVVDFDVELPAQFRKTPARPNYYPVDTGYGLFHIFIVDELRQSKENPDLLYWFPRRIFQLKRPPGDDMSLSEAMKGIDRTDILKSEDPDYLAKVEDWLSIEGRKPIGQGKNRIASLDNAVGNAMLHHLLKCGITEYETYTETPPEGEMREIKVPVQKIRKASTELVSMERFNELKKSGVLSNGKKNAEIIAAERMRIEGETAICPRCGSSNVDPRGSHCGSILCLNPGCGFDTDCG